MSKIVAQNRMEDAPLKRSHEVIQVTFKERCKIWTLRASKWTKKRRIKGQKG